MATITTSIIFRWCSLAEPLAACAADGTRVRYPKDTPMTNLLVTMLEKVGVHTDKLGDSTGQLQHLWDI